MDVIEDTVRKLKLVKGIKAAILFGSHATNKARTDSDVDVCVIGMEKQTEMKALELGSENVDISAFHRLPLQVQYRVFRDGKILFNKDDHLLTKLRFWTFKIYLDEKHWRDHFTEKVLL